jgi:hypothetical protein
MALASTAVIASRGCVGIGGGVIDDREQRSMMLICDGETVAALEQLNGFNLELLVSRHSL